MASTLVCDLLGTGYHSLSVLDLFDSALAVVKKRLGAKADDVRWFEASILQAQVPVHGYDVWHDRAVFHFLIDPADRHTYVQTVLRSVKSGGGYVIVATVAEFTTKKMIGCTSRARCLSRCSSERSKSDYAIGRGLKTLAGELVVTHEALCRTLTAIERTAEIERGDGVLLLSKEGAHRIVIQSPLSKPVAGVSLKMIALEQPQRAGRRSDQSS